MFSTACLFPSNSSCGVIYCCKWIFDRKNIYGEKFQQVGNIILWGALAEGLRMMTSTTAMVAHAQFETKPLILPSVTGAVSAITGIFFNNWVVIVFNSFV